jgi:hypothetical protein
MKNQFQSCPYPYHNSIQWYMKWISCKLVIIVYRCIFLGYLQQNSSPTSYQHAQDKLPTPERIILAGIKTSLRNLPPLFLFSLHLGPKLFSGSLSLRLSQCPSWGLLRYPRYRRRGKYFPIIGIVDWLETFLGFRLWTRYSIRVSGSIGCSIESESSGLGWDPFGP